MIESARDRIQLGNWGDTSLRRRRYCECLVFCTIPECAWWRLSGPNCMLPTQRSNRSPYSRQERNYLAQRREPRLNALAETAVAEKIDRHVFQVAELLRASFAPYNLRVLLKGPNCQPPTQPCRTSLRGFDANQAALSDAAADPRAARKSIPNASAGMGRPKKYP
jgi:hypothetical protein